MGNIVSKAEEKAEVLNAPFPSIFNRKIVYFQGNNLWAGGQRQGAE